MKAATFCWGFDSTEKVRFFIIIFLLVLTHTYMCTQMKLQTLCMLRAFTML